MALTAKQLRGRIRKLTAQIKKLAQWRAARRRQLKKLRAKGRVPGSQGGWHPNAKRVSYDSAGPLLKDVPAKLVWHTTEGVGLPLYRGTAPHITFNVKTGEIYQHIPLGQTAKALQHTRSPETNRANALQVELMAFSDAAAARRAGHPELAVENFTDADYARIARLARWIEKHAGVKRQCSVKFEARSHPLSDAAWIRYAGHLGHQHVPQNTHWDPSGSFKIAKVLA